MTDEADKPAEPPAAEPSLTEPQVAEPQVVPFSRPLDQPDETGEQPAPKPPRRRA